MNPYREQSDHVEPDRELPESDDENILVWVWFFLGCLLVLSDIGQPQPWGVAFSLGMLVLFAIFRGLRRRTQKATRNTE